MSTPLRNDELHAYFCKSWQCLRCDNCRQVLTGEYACSVELCPLAPERHFPISVGDRVSFEEERNAYTIQASSERYWVCTKPMRPLHTVLYTVVDLQEGVRGPENLIFGMGAETREQCEEMLARLESGETEISYRNRIRLRIRGIRRAKS